MDILVAPVDNEWKRNQPLDHAKKWNDFGHHYKKASARRKLAAESESRGTSKTPAKDAAGSPSNRRRQGSGSEQEEE
mgnify:CR=1 FL=1